MEYEEYDHPIIIPGENKTLRSIVKSYLDSNNNKINWNSSLLYGNLPLPFEGTITYEGNCIIFYAFGHNLQIGIGLKLPKSRIRSVEDLKRHFSWISLDKIPLPGLEGAPCNWEIFPQKTRIGNSLQVSFDSYDLTSRVLSLTINTSFVAVYGSMVTMPDPFGSPLKGTFFEVRRPIEGCIKLVAQLNLNV